MSLPLSVQRQIVERLKSLNILTMANLTNKEKIALKLLKSPEKNYNANNLSKDARISSMGCLKILKKLEEESIVSKNNMGQAFFYKISFNRLSKSYLLFLLNAEKEGMPAYAKRWAAEIENLKNTQIAILFGSILSKGEKAGDIDVILIVKENNLPALKKEIEKINKLSEKRLHPIYQTISDFKKNVIDRNSAIIEALKGLVLIGQDKFISILEEENESRRK